MALRMDLIRTIAANIQISEPWCIFYCMRAASIKGGKEIAAMILWGTKLIAFIRLIKVFRSKKCVAYMTYIYVIRMDG